MSQVNVYKDYGFKNIVGKVKYNTNLDYLWKGFQAQARNGGKGQHRGLAILDGKWVLIYADDQNGSKRGVLIDSKRAWIQILMTKYHFLDEIYEYEEEGKRILKRIKNEGHKEHHKFVAEYVKIRNEVGENTEKWEREKEIEFRNILKHERSLS